MSFSFHTLSEFWCLIILVIGITCSDNLASAAAKNSRNLEELENLGLCNLSPQTVSHTLSDSL